MLVVVGYLIILGSVFGGFMLAGGHVASMAQPLERIPVGRPGTLYRLPDGPGTIRALDLLEGKLVPVYDEMAGTPQVANGGRYRNDSHR